MPAKRAGQGMPAVTKVSSALKTSSLWTSFDEYLVVVVVVVVFCGHVGEKWREKLGVWEKSVDKLLL